VASHSEAGVGGAAQPADEAVEAPAAWERGTVVQLLGQAGRPELNETGGNENDRHATKIEIRNTFLVRIWYVLTLVRTKYVTAFLNAPFGTYLVRLCFLIRIAYTH